MNRRFLVPLAGAAVTALTIIGLASPAAAVTAQDKLNVMSSWTGTSVSSYNAWNSGRTHQSDWAAYAFDWSTDYCSASPDNPLGFDFRLSCQRHDFGYRNYKAMSAFPANKTRIDSALHEDLKRKCATYAAAVRPACESLAWTYYQAVRNLGSVGATQADIDRARDLLPAPETLPGQAPGPSDSE